MSVTSGKLKLPTSPRAATFRKVVEQLRADATLKKLGFKVRAWEGEKDDALDWAEPMCPGARLTPIGEDTAFYSPDSFLAGLMVQVELGVGGHHVDDAENLFWAFVRALYPADRDARMALQQARRDAGAQTGLVEFSGLSYALSEATAKPFTVVLFTMMLKVRLTVNP